MTERHGLYEDPATDQLPATEADVVSAHRQVRDAVEEAGRAEKELPRKVAALADKAGSEAGAKVARRIGIIGAVLAALLSVAISFSAFSNSADAKATVTAALSRLDQANTTLTARGQEPVPTPPSADPTDAIAAAVLAQVLAQLPPTPTAGEVASQLQTTVTANVLGPSLDSLTAQVVAYFQSNPPRPGPPPTEAQIRAAVDASLAANPPAQGPAGTNGTDGLTPPCMSEPTQCRGVDGINGLNGANGTNGADGQNGADSTVPGPEGPAGPAGPTCQAGYEPHTYDVMTVQGIKASSICEETPP